MCKPSNYTDNVAGTNREKTRRKSACTALQNFGRSRGKKEDNPAAPPQHRQKDVFGLHANMHLKAGARQHKDVRGSVSSCSLPLCGRSTKTFPHSWMTCLQSDSLSHWTLHDIVFHSARFSAQRQLMPCFTRTSTARTTTALSSTYVPPWTGGGLAR